MQAATQIQRDKSVHVEIIATPGTPRERRVTHRDTHQQDPNGKHHPRNPIGLAQLQSQPDRRDIDQNQHPEAQSALA